MSAFGRRFGLIAVASVLLASCGSGSNDAGVNTSTLSPITTLAPGGTLPTTTTTTTVPPTTTTTEPPVAVSSTVNGLGADLAEVERRAVVIKIDNHPDARPQSGLMEADLVYEMLVEGGLTRFATVFHQSDLTYVGPVRSGRPTDVGVVRAIDAPFLISGAQPWVKDIFRAEGVNKIEYEGASTQRITDRSAPHNLFASSILLREVADKRSWPDANPGNVFRFGSPTAGTSAATEIVFDWSDHPDVRWVWTGEAYKRFNGDEPHGWFDEAGTTGTVSTPMLVTIVGRQYLARSTDGTGSPVPTTETKGNGTVYVFRNGTVLEGSWERENYEDPFTLMTLDGRDLVLPPSRMWIVIFPDDRTITWQ